LSIFFRPNVGPRPMGCSASTTAVETVEGEDRDTASNSPGKGDLCDREADYSVSAGTLFHSPSSTVTSLDMESTLSRLSTGSDSSLNPDKWAAARPVFRSPPPRSAVRVRAKGNPESHPARKYRGSFGSFQNFYDLAEKPPSLLQPSGPTPEPQTPVAVSVA